MATLTAKLLVLFAVLLMPLGMLAAPAAAAPRPSASMPMPHCPEQAPSHDSKRGFTACTMACSGALPAADLPQEEHLLIAAMPSAPAAVPMLHGVQPDTETPPPKRS